ncbi:MAG TPA: hypothetical protein VLM85_09410 [Polyangiaceae bacterium]|nr:hypothetical protein [Polyangiaceae bacterium]
MRAIDLVAGFELDLHATIAARTRLGWVLHAGAFVVDGRAGVLIGPSGERVAIDASARVRGLPPPACRTLPRL